MIYGAPLSTLAGAGAYVLAYADPEARRSNAAQALLPLALSGSLSRRALQVLNIEPGRQLVGVHQHPTAQATIAQ